MICSLSCLFLFVSAASGQNLQQIKAQMQQRQAAINALKDQGAIGEGVDGFLHVRNNTGNAQQIVNAENQDRRTVNNAIAKKEGTTVEDVSKTLAVKLIQNARPGHWIWRGGSWQQK